MTSITQTIPNYFSGISEQPDELKTPGQLKVAKNVLPDVTQGLIKRPGGKLIGHGLGAFDFENSPNENQWFHYYRDENEQYIGQIKLDTGDIKMWSCETGTSCTVVYDAGKETVLKNYLKQVSDGTIKDSDLQTLTLNDYTYILNRNRIVKMSDTVEPTRSPEAFIELKKVAYASQYAVNLFDDDDDDTDDTQTVSTVTRLSVERIASSNNYCTVSGKNMRLHSARINKSIDHSPCDDSCGVGRDGFAPNVGTRIFAISDNVSLIDDNAVGGDVPSDAAGGSVLVKDGGSGYSSAPTVTISAPVTVTTGKETWQQNTPYSVTDITKNGSRFYECTTEGTSASSGDGPTGTETGIADGGAVWKHVGTLATATATVDGGKVVRVEITSMGTGYSSAAISITGNAVVELKTITERNYNYEVQVTDKDGETANNNAKNLYFRLTTTGQSVPDTEDNSERTVYQARYTTTHDLLYGGEGWNEGDYFHVWLKDAYYKITVEAVSIAKVKANLGLIRPIPTSFDTKTTVTAESILADIRTNIINDNDTGNNFTENGVEQIGNGLYIKRNSGVSSDPFQISTPVSNLLNVFTDSVKDVADLPSQCKHGYVVKVANSEAEEDDYYVKFIGKQKADGTFLDGEGVWEECPKPGVKIEINPETMPVQLVRRQDDSYGTLTGTAGAIYFVVEQITWENRLVGDELTVPEPSFMKTSDGEIKSSSNTYVGTINKMLFFRNRLVMLSDENVIMSRPGDFFNFWPKSAITYTATDNIDLSCSSEYPAIVYDGIQVNSGLVLFTKNQQFMLTTDSDVLSPLTAKINSLSSYNFNFRTTPVSLGTTIAFLDNAGQYTRFWEMTAVLREGEPNVLEQSKAISKSFPSDINMIANSRENQVIFFGIKGTKKLYGFRYHTTAAQRIQQAWFEWELSGDIQHIAMLDDALFAIVKTNSTYTMQRFSIRGLSNSLVVTDNQNTTDDTTDDVTYRVYLDNSVAISSRINYNSETKKSSFTKPGGFGTSDTGLVVISTGTGSSGRYTTATINGSDIELDGDWSSEDVVLGYNYDMQVEFPTIYVQASSSGQFRSKIHDSLVIHRVKLSLGPSGIYETILQRIGKVDYTQLHETPLADSYGAGSVAIEHIIKKTVPIYEKNTNLTLTLKSTHPTPATLHSMTWQGDYTNTFYQSV